MVRTQLMRIEECMDAASVCACISMLHVCDECDPSLRFGSSLSQRVAQYDQLRTGEEGTAITADIGRNLHRVEQHTRRAEEQANEWKHCAALNISEHLHAAHSGSQLDAAKRRAARRHSPLQADETWMERRRRMWSSSRGSML